MKNIMIALNAIALIAVLGACSKKVEVTSEGNGSLVFPTPTPTTDLQISETLGDGKYNSVELNDSNINEFEKTFYYTPADNMKIQLGSSGVSGIDCQLSTVTTLLEFQRLDSNGGVISSQRLDYYTPALALDKGAKYGVRAKLTGTRGCRSVFLSFTIEKAT